MRKTKFKSAKDILYLLLFTFPLVFLSACSSDDDDTKEDEKPKPKEEVTVADNVYICDDNTGNDMIVTELKDDGTVMISPDSKHKPQVGDIIVSGANDVAPYGFIYKVKSISDQNGQIMVSTEEAYLEEVLPDAHIDMDIPFNDVRTPDGKHNIATRGQKDIDFLTFSDTFEKKLNKSKEWDLNAFGSLEIKNAIHIVYDSSWGKVQRCGASADGSLKLKIGIEAKLEKALKDVIPNVLDIELMTATFWVGGVLPVSATFHLYADVEISTKGKASFKWTPLEPKLFSYEGHCFWNRDPDIYGSNWDIGKEFNTPFKDFSFQTFLEDFFHGLSDIKLALSGEVKISFKPRLQARLYNNENMVVGLGISPYVKAKGELAIEYEYNKGTKDDIEVKDDITFSVGADFDVDARFKISSLIDAKLPEEKSKFNLFDYPLFEGGLLLPSYDYFSVYPEENALERDYVHVSALKSPSVLTFWADKDYGFCYAEVKKDNNGKELPKLWNYVSLWDKYHGLAANGQYLELDIPTNQLKAGATYDVRPYSVVMWLDTIKRKGGVFSMGGAVGEGGSTIVDVPGENF